MSEYIECGSHVTCNESSVSWNSQQANRSPFALMVFSPLKTKQNKMFLLLSLKTKQNKMFMFLWAANGLLAVAPGRSCTYTLSFELPGTPQPLKKKAPQKFRAAGQPSAFEKDGAAKVPSCRMTLTGVRRFFDIYYFCKVYWVPLTLSISV